MRVEQKELIGVQLQLSTVTSELDNLKACHNDTLQRNKELMIQNQRLNQQALLVGQTQAKQGQERINAVTKSCRIP